MIASSLLTEVLIILFFPCSSYKKGIKTLGKAEKMGKLFWSDLGRQNRIPVCFKMGPRD